MRLWLLLLNYALERSVTGSEERASRGPLNADVRP
jgi:hypothetical protein